MTWHSSNIRFYFLGRLPCARPRPFDFILTLINLSQFTHFSCWACPNGPKGDQPDRDLCSCLFSLFFSQQFDTRVSRKDRTIHDVSRLCALSLILSTLLDIVVVADVILEFRQNELAPVFQYTRLDLYTHHFGVYIGYIHDGILRSLNSVELHWIELEPRRDEGGSEKTNSSSPTVLSLFLISLKYFFAFLSFLLCVCVLFQSPTHDLTSLVVCLSSALLFCFFAEGVTERTASITKHTAAVAVVVYIIKGQKLDMLLVSFLFLQAVIRSFIGWLYLVLVFFWGVSLCRWLFFPQICLSAQLSAWRGFKRKVIWNHRPSTSSWLGRSRLADAQSSPSRPLLTSFSSSSSSSSSRIGKRRRRKAIKCPFENVSLLSSSLLLLKRQASSGRKIQQLSRELYYTRL